MDIGQRHADREGFLFEPCKKIFSTEKGRLGFKYEKRLRRHVLKLEGHFKREIHTAVDLTTAGNNVKGAMIYSRRKNKCL